MRTSPGMSSFFVVPISGWISRPSQISSAHFVRYSCARWMGLRVWNATMRFQPFSLNSSRVCTGVRLYSSCSTVRAFNTWISPPK